MTTAIDRCSVSTILLTAGAVFAAQTAFAAGWKGVGEFEDASFRVERNATDGDTEIVVTAKPLTDNGLVRLTVLSPHWRTVAEVEAPHRSHGLREFLFETPEPEESAILRHYPEGDYLFFGTASTGQRFVGSAALSHELPGEATIVSPVEESVIVPGALTIIWAAVPDAAHTSWSSRTRARIPSNRSRSSWGPSDVVRSAVRNRCAEQRLSGRHRVSARERQRHVRRDDVFDG